MKHLSISLGRLKLRIPLSDLEKLTVPVSKPAKAKAAPPAIVDTRPIRYYNGGYNPDNIKPRQPRNKQAPVLVTPEVLAPAYTPRYSASRENWAAIIRKLEVGQERIVPDANPASAVSEATKVVVGMRYHVPGLRVCFRREPEGVRMVRLS